MTSGGTYKIPVSDEDYERAMKLANWLAEQKWTIGQAKMAFAVWFEEIGVPIEGGPEVMIAEMRDLGMAIGELRGSR